MNLANVFDKVNIFRKSFNDKGDVLTIVARSTCFQSKMEHFQNECWGTFPCLSDFLAKNDYYEYHIKFSVLHSKILK